MDQHIKILFVHDAFGEESFESAWAKNLGKGYELDNILFYSKNYSLGDIVSVEERDGELYVTGLIEEGGHSTVRVLTKGPKMIPTLRKNLEDMGCSSELSNFERLIAVDIPPNASYGKIRSFLEKGENEGKWEYQEACIASNHLEN